MRRILAGLAIGATTVLALATPAQAAQNSWTTQINDSPDDPIPGGEACSAWARDTFKRTTRIAPIADGVWRVTITDRGTFTLPGEGGRSGDLVGSGEYKVTGERLANPQVPDTVDNSKYDCKAEAAASKPEWTTGNWWRMFFAETAESDGIVNWRWTYTLKCNGKVQERRVETSSGATGVITGEKKCDPPATESPSPSPSASASKPAGGAAGGASPTPTEPAQAASLPVTGASVPLLAGVAAALLVGGGAALVAARRRRTRFTA